VRLWAVAWLVCVCAALIVLRAPWWDHPDETAGWSRSSFCCAAFAAALASFAVRRRLVLSQPEKLTPEPARVTTLDRQTVQLACVWALDCVVVLAAAVLATRSLWTGLLVALSGVCLLVLTPPKILPDADPP